MKDNKIKLVKRGYEVAAGKYREEKSMVILDLMIFKQWLSLINKGPILDLGCGSGYPLASELFNRNISYLGIDLAKNQIKIAKEQFPLHQESFKEGEMLQFCKQSEKNIFEGAIVLFSIFHLPREKHCELLSELRRILKSGAPILITVSDQEHEDFERNWLGADQMWWSSFSHKWYEQTLEELQFEEVMKYQEKVLFNKSEEINWYLLFRVIPS